MKKIFIAVVSILVIIFILILVITNISTIGFKKDVDSIKKDFLNKNKDVSINNIDVYYSEDTYYIIDYKKNNKDYIEVESKKGSIYTVEKDKLYKLDKTYNIGYNDGKLIYEVKKNSKDGFTYSYYDALTGEFIKKIKLDK